MTPTITVADRRRPLGNKAANLEWLADRGVRVPRAWVVTSPADLSALDIPASGVFAVRSSGLAEDTTASAHAGELLTELDVTSSGLQASVSRVLASGADAVIVQHMVHPIIASGVAFSRNPVTGLSDVIVEAIRSRGDALLAHGADPLRWVSRQGEMVDAPPDAPDLNPVADQVVRETVKLAAEFGPADLEWVWDGSELWWVQIRPITGIGDVPIFSRRIAKDVLPGLIKPLVWSINVPMVNRAWIRLFTEAIGPNNLEPEDLARAFAYRAYFDMRAIGDIFEMVGMPRDSLENLMGLPGAQGRMRPGLRTIGKTPRMLWLGLRLATGASRFEAERGRLHEAFVGAAATDLAALTDEKLAEHADRLASLGEASAYLNIVVPLMEGLVTKRLQRRLDKVGAQLDQLASTDPAWDPRPRIARLADALEHLEPARRARVLGGDLGDLDDASSAALQDVLHHHGYLSENTNDLSVPRWRDVPETVIRLATSADRTQTGREATLDRRTRGRVRRWRRWRRLRDAVGATWAFGYGLLRPVYLEMGRRLVGRGAIGSSDDVFFVERGALVSALLAGGPPALSPEVERTKAEMEAVADVVMPETIVGDSWVPESPDVTNRMVGVGVSRGRYRGTARFVGRLAEADRLEDGDVLVVEHSDVAWTPLFSRVGAVVSSTGGLLAHSSITAREMGVPCVASVANARILDGRTILVDGYTGEVFVED